MTPRPAAPIVEFHDVTVAYGGRPALWNVDLTIPEPCLFGIIGPNGAGKSTLLKAALGLVPLVGGEVRFFGEPLARVRSRVGYVPQRETVDWDFPVSVLDVVLMGTYGRLGWLRRPGRRERDLARHCLARVGLVDLADRQIGRLSGGQQQRVFLARALISRPDLLVLDEPTSGVDMRTAETILHLLADLNRQGLTILMPTHDLNAAAAHVPWLVCLNLTVVAEGPPEQVFTEAVLSETYRSEMVVVRHNGALLVHQRPHAHTLQEILPQPVLGHPVVETVGGQNASHPLADRVRYAVAD